MPYALKISLQIFINAKIFHTFTTNFIGTNKPEYLSDDRTYIHSRKRGFGRLLRGEQCPHAAYQDAVSETAYRGAR
jgi:hypothetical protein